MLTKALLLFIAITLLIPLILWIELKRPLGKILFRQLTPKLKTLKAKSIARPSPFEKTDSSLWLAESSNAYALKDIRPRAPHHYLVIPKHRINTLLEAPPELLAEMMDLCRQVAKQANIDQEGFRIVINTNPQGLQTVYHLHMHVLGGRQMGLPVG